MTRPQTKLEPGRTSTPRAFRSALLGWTDPESGEHLTVKVRGSDSFLRGLEPIGFEQLADLDPEPSTGWEPCERLSAQLAGPRRCPPATTTPLAPAPPRGLVPPSDRPQKGFKPGS